MNSILHHIAYQSQYEHKTIMFLNNLLLCYDLTNAASFDALDKWKDGFIENAGPDDPKSFPFVLIGNKVDRESERKVSAEKARAWCKENNDMAYFETSAKEGVSVTEAFIEMVRKGIAREQNN